MSVVTIDVVPIGGEPMWHAVVNGKEYLEKSGRRLRDLVSRLTAASDGTATMEAVQD